MSSENKDYEMVAQNQQHSEADIIPQGIPVQNPYTPQYIHPQNQIITYPQQYQYPPQMVMVIPNQHIQQPMPQYMGGAAPQFLPVIHEMNPVQLAAKRQEYEQEIQKSKFAVPLNWVMIVIHLLLGVVSILVVANLGIDSFTDIFLTLFVVLITFLLMLLHYRAITAYHKRNPSQISCVFLFFAFLLGLQIVLFSVIGVLIYGYLAYWAYRMKTLFSEFEKIDKQISQQGAGNISASTYQPDNQIQMATL